MRQTFCRSDLDTLKYFLILMKNCGTGARIEEDLQILSTKIRNSRVVKNKSLGSMVKKQTVSYPWDIRADAMALYRKWHNGVLDPYRFYGIDSKSGKNNKNNERNRFISRSPDKSAPTSTPLPTEHLNMCIEVLYRRKVL